MKKNHRSEESTDDRHGKDRAEQTKARAEQVRREVELLYKQADQAPPDCGTPCSAETLSLKASGYHKSSLSCCIQIKK
jgi:proline racemase